MFHSVLLLFVGLLVPHADGCFVSRGAVPVAFTLYVLGLWICPAQANQAAQGAAIGLADGEGAGAAAAVRDQCIGDGNGTIVIHLYLWIRPERRNLYTRNLDSVSEIDVTCTQVFIATYQI